MWSQSISDSSTRASWARASRCSTALVEPPIAITTEMALSSDCLVMSALVRKSRSSRPMTATASGVAVMGLLERDLRTRALITKQSLDNAISVVMAIGGSTNAVLHLLALAHEARVELSLMDCDHIRRRVPHIVDSRPHGRFLMSDIDAIGGIPVVMRMLLDAGLLHGDALPVR